MSNVMLRRLKQVHTGDDREGGFAIILVTLVITMVTIGVGAMMYTTSPAISGAKRAEASTAATAAARSGIEDVIAYLVGIPSCRSESRICPAALGASSAALAAAGNPRPSLANGQSYSWTTASTPTADGFVRATSTGKYTANGTFAKTNRTLVADLSLRPSILAYGYFTDYESLSPSYLQSFYNKRYIYATDCSSGGITCSTSSPQWVSWTGATDASVCGQHWYAESATIKGRAAANDLTPVTQGGKYGATKDAGTSVTAQYGCDLVFSSAMVQNGKTFSRDAMLMSGTGPTFNQAVYTMWGYKDGSKDYTSPAFSPAGQYYRGDPMSNGTIRPQVASADLSLPASIGKDGIPENACTYYGPTRVKLNGDGTATVTSPLTRTKNATSDSACYPASVASGVVGFNINYNTLGGGAIVVRNVGTAPAAGWPANQTLSTQTPSAANEVFYFTAPGGTDPARNTDVTPPPAYATCSTTIKYPSDACAWSNLDSSAGTSTVGWTAYTNATCNTTIAATNRQLFECEYAGDTTNKTRAVTVAGGSYKTLRDLVYADLNTTNCANATDHADCVNAIVANRLKVANTGGTVNGTATNGARRYVATTVAGTPSAPVVTTGSAGTGPSGTTDTFFVQPKPASESRVKTTYTTTVKRQTYSSNAWGGDTAAFSMVTTESDYTYTAARGMTYFPNEKDVTPYNVGTDTAGTAYRGTAATVQTGDRQPGDLYIDGANKGKLSVLAENDVVVTGDITNPSGYTPDSDAVSITAGQDVRNYHPVSCTDQTDSSINNTTPGWCPNDLSGITTAAAATSGRYANIDSVGDRSIYAAVFALNGSFGTDNYRRAPAVGNLRIYGGLYQSHRGGNGVVSGGTQVNGTSLQYTYVDLQRANLPYVPPSTSGNDVRPWNVVSISSG